MKPTERELVETLEQLYNACRPSGSLALHNAVEKAKDVILRATSEPYIESFPCAECHGAGYTLMSDGGMHYKCPCSSCGGEE